MDSSKIKKIVLLVVVVALAGVGIWWFLRPSAELPAPSKSVDSSPKPSAVVKEKTAVQNNLSKQIEGKSQEEIGDYAQVLKVSRYFVERYGSFSSDAAWQNLQDVKLVVTDDLWQDFEDLMDKPATQENFYSMQTKVLSLTVDSIDEDSAKVTASVQQTETKGNKQNITYNKKGLELIKEQGEWKVSNFFDK